MHVVRLHAFIRSFWHFQAFTTFQCTIKLMIIEHAWSDAGPNPTCAMG